MKTAISLPDEIFHRASQRANALGLSRSEFFARAATSYLHELDAVSITQQIDDALDSAGVEDDSHAVAVEAGRQFLAEDSEEW